MTANKGKVLLQVQGLEKKFDDNQVWTVSPQISVRVKW